MGQEQNISAQLRDIKPLMEIPDISYYIYWGLIIFASVLAAGILFFVFKKLWDNRKVNLQKGYLASIKRVDWVETKRSAYEATHYARLLATDEKRQALFSQLESKLEPYKYKKEVNEIDDETKKLFNLYVQVADESV